jgi:hypothetical protein
MTEEMAVKDKVANVWSAKVEAELNGGVGVGRIPIPEGNLDRIQILAGDGRRLLGAVDLEVVLRLHEEVNLMDVEGVVLRGAVLNDAENDQLRSGGVNCSNLSIGVPHSQFAACLEVDVVIDCANYPMQAKATPQGHLCAPHAQRVIKLRLPCGSPIRRTARANIRSNTSRNSAASGRLALVCPAIVPNGASFQVAQVRGEGITHP